MLESHDSTGRQRVPSRKRAQEKESGLFPTIVLIVVLALVGWWNRFWPEKHIAGKFFSALQKQDFETAYGIYYADPALETASAESLAVSVQRIHARLGTQAASGASSRRFQIYGASNCPGGGSGVVVDVIVNDRAQHAQLYVDKTDKTISSPPCDLEFH